MALPTPDKTWQFNVNQVLADQGTLLASARRMMRTIKNSMVGFGSSPWTVRYSCNSSVAGSAGDGVDRWTADTDLVWSATTRSWIVLRQTGIATNYEICIDLNFSSAQTCTVMCSPSAGFTGGTTSARPTATDEYQINVNSNGWGVNSGNTSNLSALHVMQSSDGQVTYVIVMQDNVAQAFWIMARPKNPVSGWSNPSVSMVFVASPNSGTPTEAFMHTQHFAPANAYARGRGPSSVMSIFFTSEGHITQLLCNSLSGLNAPNDLSGEYPMFPVGFASRTTAHRGRHGQLFDLWLGLEITNHGDTYPNDTSRQFVQIGDLIFPWNGSVPLIS